MKTTPDGKELRQCKGWQGYWVTEDGEIWSYRNGREAKLKVRVSGKDVRVVIDGMMRTRTVKEAYQRAWGTI